MMPAGGAGAAAAGRRNDLLQAAAVHSSLEDCALRLTAYGRPRVPGQADLGPLAADLALPGRSIGVIATAEPWESCETIAGVPGGANCEPN